MLRHFPLSVLGSLLAILTFGQQVPVDLWGEEPQPNHGYIKNQGQFLTTNGDPADGVDFIQRGVFPEVALHNTPMASFFWAFRDQDTTTTDTTFRITVAAAGEGMFPVGPAALDEFPGSRNYYLGHAPGGIEGVPSFGNVIYENAFDKIDMVWSSNRLGTKLYVEVAPFWREGRRGDLVGSGRTNTPGAATSEERLRAG